MFNSAPSYDESWLWNKGKVERPENKNSAERFESTEKEKENLEKKIKSSINNINRIISRLWMNPEFLDTVNKKMKGLPTFDACGILIGEIEKLCDKDNIPLLEEYRYRVNTAKQDIKLMNIIEESLKVCFELGKISKSNSQQNERKTQSPFGTNFFRPIG